jgi:hypothetical protein
MRFKRVTTPSKRLTPLQCDLVKLLARAAVMEFLREVEAEDDCEQNVDLEAHLSIKRG